MNTSLVTTGQIPLTLGSVQQFVLGAFQNGLFWNLAGGIVNLIIAAPNGAETIIPATITNGVASAQWTVTAPIGTGWTRAWQCTDASGVYQVSQPIVFSVVSSPI